MIKFSQLFPALVECFAIILFGYISGRLSIITPKQAEGLGKFVGAFVLPALLFKSMVELDFATVSWSFMVAVFLGKAVVFFLVLGFSAVMIKTNMLGRGSLYAIFVTQSNDFALGYPLIQALYGQSHPEFLQYIYLIAPISLLILNPIGFVLLEINKLRSGEQEYMLLEDRDGSQSGDNESLQIGEEINVVDEDVAESDRNGRLDQIQTPDEQNGFTARSCLNVAKGVLLNPLVFMVFIGLAGHFIFHGKLPAIIGNTLGTLAKAYSGSALFYLGLTMTGKISKQKATGFLLPVVLIVAKIILLPILIREFMLVLTNTLPTYCPPGIARNSTNMTEYIFSLADFGYLYGTFPTSPTVVIYAAQYGIEVDRLAAGMVLCTSLSAPIMYISAWTLSMSRMSADYFQQEVLTVDKDISIVTLFCSVWCIVIFVIGRKFARVPHAITLGYIFGLFFSSLGTVFWDAFRVDTLKGTQLFLFGMMFFGVKSARLFTASMALALVMVLSRGQRWLWDHCYWFIFGPFAVAFATTVALMSSSNMPKMRTDGVFVYGKAQDIASLAIITLSFIITVCCLLSILKMHGYHERPESSTTPLLPRTNSINSELSTSDDDTGLFSQEEQRVCCLFRTKCSFGDIQKVRHIVLLLLLTLSLAIGICLVVWRLSGNLQAGVYFEVAFLDSVFNFGQGFFVFCLFGLDSDLIIDPFVRFYRKLRYGLEDISLPDLNTIDRAGLLQCLQFTKYHLDDCKLEIVRDRRSGLTIYQEVFTGTDFCTWLLDRGLVNDRAEAKIYGQNLVLGRVLYHHMHKHYFYDHNYLYKFEEPKICYRINRSNVGNSSLNNSGSGMEGNSLNVPTTSRRLDVPNSPTQQLNPVGRPYYGYSFEAHLTRSEADGIPGSLRKHLRARVSSPSKLTSSSNSTHNNSKQSDLSLARSFHEERIFKRKPPKKITPKMMTGPFGDFSDSS